MLSNELTRRMQDLAASAARVEQAKHQLNHLLPSLEQTKLAYDKLSADINDSNTKLNALRRQFADCEHVQDVQGMKRIHDCADMQRTAHLQLMRLREDQASVGKSLEIKRCILYDALQQAWVSWHTARRMHFTALSEVVDATEVQVQPADEAMVQEHQVQHQKQHNQQIQHQVPSFKHQQTNAQSQLSINDQLDLYVEVARLRTQLANIERLSAKEYRDEHLKKLRKRAAPEAHQHNQATQPNTSLNAYSATVTLEKQVLVSARKAAEKQEICRRIAELEELLKASGHQVTTTNSMAHTSCQNYFC